MFYKKFAAVVLSAVLVGVVPSVVFADADGISAVSDGDVEDKSTLIKLFTGYRFFQSIIVFDFFCFCQCSGG